MATKHKPADTERLRHEYAMAVLTGIYASNGRAILNVEDPRKYEQAQADACTVAFDQADRCIRAHQGAA